MDLEMIDSYPGLPGVSVFRSKVCVCVWLGEPITDLTLQVWYSSEQLG